MSSYGLSARNTPSSRTPESGTVQIASEGRASRAVARALAVLIERLTVLDPDGKGVADGLSGLDPTNPHVLAVRDALRGVSARSREGALLCRVMDGLLVLEGVPVERAASDDLLTGTLLSRLTALGVGSLTIREGASPGELLTLGRLLAQSPRAIDMRSVQSSPRAVDVAAGDTPSTVRAVTFADETPRELLRTWSVLVTPLVRAAAPATSSGAAAIVLTRLAAAHTDDAATSAVAGLNELLDDAERRGDAIVVEHIARACLLHMQSVGESGGRLALEATMRYLLRAPLLDLLATQLPHSTDRNVLVQLFARAGDFGVATLVQQLLTTDDALARRAFFDSIVAIDVGSSTIFDALHDPRWFVVRNAAALLGEMQVEYADDALILLLQHHDARIRIAIARALVRLRTVKAMHALHGMIDDEHAEVRRLSAAAFGIAGNVAAGGHRPPAARLSAAFEREADEDVALEMLAALGRLGSADAVQRLLRIALPPTPDITGAAAPEVRESSLRIAALDALVRARGTQMKPVVESLMNDPDVEVAAAAGAMRGAAGS